MTPIDVLHTFVSDFAIPIPTIILSDKVSYGVRPRKGLVVINPKLTEPLLTKVLVHELFHEYVSHKGLNFPSIDAEEEWVCKMTDEYLNKRFYSSTCPWVEVALTASCLLGLTYLFLRGMKR